LTVDRMKPTGSRVYEFIQATLSTFSTTQLCVDFHAPLDSKCVYNGKLDIFDAVRVKEISSGDV
jgi:hypothetical protein